MPFDTGIADRLRAAGLSVVEVAGWRTRGSSAFNPRGCVQHHTAGPRAGNIPSLGILVNGRSDLPGPLCNIATARDNTIYVVAAGRANHAGSGGWRGLSGNSSVYGNERESSGTSAEPWRPDQHEAAARADAALLRGRGIDAAMHCLHREWTSRKPDVHSVTGDHMRALVRSFLTDHPKPPPPPPAPPQEDDLSEASDRIEKTLARVLDRLDVLERRSVRVIADPKDPTGAVYLFHGGQKVKIADGELHGAFIQALRLPVAPEAWGGIDRIPTAN